MPTPEILAPAGGPEALRAALCAGADAVYFGLRRFSARARAENFEPSQLATWLYELHQHGVRGYVALNTLAFDRELPEAARLISVCAEAGADAVIVQELGILRLVRAVAPTLPVHLSTQATAAGVEDLRVFERLGVRRVVLPRELDLGALQELRQRTTLELEVFVHGALCIAFSGQCLASFAFGGRSANRGQCAQPCRLPYAILRQGTPLNPGADRILSPCDLDACELVERLAELGIDALKIEGRLKSPGYVGATVALYRQALEGWRRGDKAELAALRRDASVAYSRGGSRGWLGGVDYLALVDGGATEHRGLRVASVQRIRQLGRKSWLLLELEREIQRGAGLRVGEDGGCAGRAWSVRVRREGQWVDEPRASPGSLVSIWLGPEVTVPAVAAGAPVYQTDDPTLETRPSKPPRVGLEMRLLAAAGEVLLTGRTQDGRQAEARVRAEPGPAPVGADSAWFAQKLGRLGDTPYELRQLLIELPPMTSLPASALNQARRVLVARLSEQARRTHRSQPADPRTLLDQTELPEPLPPGWFVLVRRLGQVRPVLNAGVDGVYLDLDSDAELCRAESLCRRRGVVTGRVTPRVELGRRGQPSPTGDWLLARTHGPLKCSRQAVADATLHASNRLSVAELLLLGARAVTPCAEVEPGALQNLGEGRLGPYLEVVVYQHLPLFFTRYCLHAKLAGARSPEACAGACRGPPLSLLDRTGAEHPILTDADCHNTVFQGQPREIGLPSTELIGWGIRRLRIELLDEGPREIDRILTRLRAR